MIVSKILLYAKVARAQTLLMTVSLILCSFLYSWYNYQCDFNPCFLFVAISILSFHLAANTISEYRDCVKGVDNIHSPGTKYRLITGILPRKNVYHLGGASFFIGALSGMCALYFGTMRLMIPGAIAAFIVYSYSEKPLCLKYKAFGELCVFAIYGPLLFASCVIALTNQVSLDDLLFSVPFGLLTTCVLLANNIRDYEFEKGKTVTLTIKYGLRFSYFLLFFMVNLSFLLIIFIAYKHLVPYSSIFVFLTYPLVFASISKIDKPEFINIFGILQVSFTVIICISFLIKILLKS